MSLSKDFFYKLRDPSLKSSKQRQREVNYGNKDYEQEKERVHLEDFSFQESEYNESIHDNNNLLVSNSLQSLSTINFSEFEEFEKSINSSTVLRDSTKDYEKIFKEIRDVSIEEILDDSFDIPLIPDILYYLIKFYSPYLLLFELKQSVLPTFNDQENKLFEENLTSDIGINSLPKIDQNVTSFLSNLFYFPYINNNSDIQNNKTFILKFPIILSLIYKCHTNLMSLSYSLGGEASNIMILFLILAESYISLKLFRPALRILLRLRRGIARTFTLSNIIKARLYTDLGIVYYNVNRFALAIDSFLISLNVFQKNQLGFIFLKNQKNPASISPYSPNNRMHLDNINSSSLNNTIDEKKQKIAFYDQFFTNFFSQFELTDKFDDDGVNTNDIKEQIKEEIRKKKISSNKNSDNLLNSEHLSPETYFVLLSDCLFHLAKAYFYLNQAENCRDVLYKLLQLYNEKENNAEKFIYDKIKHVKISKELIKCLNYNPLTSNNFYKGYINEDIVKIMFFLSQSLIQSSFNEESNQNHKKNNLQKKKKNNNINQSFFSNNASIIDSNNIFHLENKFQFVKIEKNMSILKQLMTNEIELETEAFNLLISLINSLIIVKGEDHFYTLKSLNNLSKLYMLTGELKKSEILFNFSYKLGWKLLDEFISRLKRKKKELVVLEKEIFPLSKPTIPDEIESNLTQIDSIEDDLGEEYSNNKRERDQNFLMNSTFSQVLILLSKSTIYSPSSPMMNSPFALSPNLNLSNLNTLDSILSEPNEHKSLDHISSDSSAKSGSSEVDASLSETLSVCSKDTHIKLNSTFLLSIPLIFKKTFKEQFGPNELLSWGFQYGLLLQQILTELPPSDDFSSVTNENENQSSYSSLLLRTQTHFEEIIKVGIYLPDWHDQERILSLYQSAISSIIISFSGIKNEENIDPYTYQYMEPISTKRNFFMLKSPDVCKFGESGTLLTQARRLLVYCLNIHLTKFCPLFGNNFSSNSSQISHLSSLYSNSSTNYYLQFLAILTTFAKTFIIESYWKNRNDYNILITIAYNLLNFIYNNLRKSIRTYSNQPYVLKFISFYINFLIKNDFYDVAEEVIKRIQLYYYDYYYFKIKTHCINENAGHKLAYEDFYKKRKYDNDYSSKKTIAFLEEYLSYEQNKNQEILFYEYNKILNLKKNSNNLIVNDDYDEIESKYKEEFEKYELELKIYEDKGEIGESESEDEDENDTGNEDSEDNDNKSDSQSDEESFKKEDETDDFKFFDKTLSQSSTQTFSTRVSKLSESEKRKKTGYHDDIINEEDLEDEIDTLLTSTKFSSFIDQQNIDLNERLTLKDNFQFNEAKTKSYEKHIIFNRTSFKFINSSDISSVNNFNKLKEVSLNDIVKMINYIVNINNPFEIFVTSSSIIGYNIPTEGIKNRRVRGRNENEEDERVNELKDVDYDFFHPYSSLNFSKTSPLMNFFSVDKTLYERSYIKPRAKKLFFEDHVNYCEMLYNYCILQEKKKRFLYVLKKYQYILIISYHLKKILMIWIIKQKKMIKEKLFYKIAATSVISNSSAILTPEILMIQLRDAFSNDFNHINTLQIFERVEDLIKNTENQVKLAQFLGRRK